MILPVTKQQLDNLEYYRSFEDQLLLLRLKEAETIWFRALMTDVKPEEAMVQHQTIAFWQQAHDDLRFVAKERNLI